MKTAYLIASGDLRISANQKCQEAQAAMEKQVTQAIEREGWKVWRAHPFDPKKKNGFIDSQKYGMQVIRDIPTDAPLVVAEAVWQYSHHVLSGIVASTSPMPPIRPARRKPSSPRPPPCRPSAWRSSSAARCDAGAPGSANLPIGIRNNPAYGGTFRSQSGDWRSRFA